MDVKDAIAAAKAYVDSLYEGSERIADVSLEEVEFDGTKDEWHITLEFSRPANNPFRTRARELLQGAMPGDDMMPRRRVQKVVLVSDRDGTAIAMKNREAA